MIYNNRGKSQFNLDQYDKAIADYNKALQLKVDYSKALDNRSQAYFRSGNWQGVKDDLEKLKG